MKMPIRPYSCVFCVVLGLLAGALQAATFTPLGDLAGGEFDSVTTDISDDGLIVSGFSESDLGTEAFRWTESGGLVALSSLTGETLPTIARAISDTGVIVGQLDFTEEQCTVDNEIFPQAARWTEEDGFVPLGGATQFAHDVSADGTVVTGATCEFSEDGEFTFHQPYRWSTTDGLQLFGHAGEAFGISADGNVIAGFGPLNNAFQAFRWTEETGSVPLELPDGSLARTSEAYDISASGDVLVGAFIESDESDVVQAFRWSEETGLVGLGHLVEGFDSFAYDLSDDGTVIVGDALLSDEEVVATIWDPENGLRDLKSVLIEDFALGDALEGWTLRRGNGISADGRSIVGFATNPDGNQEAFLIQLDAMPPDLLTGDYNANGTVEQADLDLVLLNWGQPGTPNGWTNDLPNGNIDQAELDGVLLNWGDTAAGGLATASVPEPSTVLLAVLLAAASLRARRLCSPGNPT